MAIKFIPSNQEVTVIGDEEHKALIKSLLACVVDGLHRVEKQLEKITDEEIDSDERRLL